MLTTSTDPIKQIAWDYQFSDTSCLCRYFKQHAGQTPQQFRIGQAEHPLI